MRDDRLRGHDSPCKYEFITSSPKLGFRSPRDVFKYLSITDVYNNEILWLKFKDYSKRKSYEMNIRKPKVVI